MSLRERWDGLSPEAFTGGGLTIREVRDDGDLWFVTAELFSGAGAGGIGQSGGL